MSRAIRGFTLMELVLVLTILGVLAGITLPAFTSLGMAKRTEAAEPMLKLLRDARRLAITRGSVVSVALDPTSRHYRVDTTSVTGGVGTLIDTTLVVAPGTTLSADSARVHFLFMPTGAAIGDTIRLFGKEGQRTIVVDPWEGMPNADTR